MTNKTLIALAFVAAALMTTSVAYATSDWRTACGINSPIDNLECAVDHVETELNSLVSGITQNSQDISDLDARVTALESNPSFVPTIYNVQVSTWTVSKDGATFQTTDPTEVFACNEGDIELDLVAYKDDTFTNSIGNVIENQFLYSPEYVIQRTNVDGQLNQHWFMMGDLSLGNGIQTEQLYLRCLDITP